MASTNTANAMFSSSSLISPLFDSKQPLSASYYYQRRDSMCSSVAISVISDFFSEQDEEEAGGFADDADDDASAIVHPSAAADIDEVFLGDSGDDNFHGVVGEEEDRFDDAIMTKLDDAFDDYRRYGNNVLSSPSPTVHKSYFYANNKGQLPVAPLVSGNSPSPSPAKTAGVRQGNNTRGTNAQTMATGEGAYVETRLANLRSSMEETKRSRRSLLSSVRGLGPIEYDDLVVQQEMYDRGIAASAHRLAESVMIARNQQQQQQQQFHNSSWWQSPLQDPPSSSRRQQRQQQQQQQQQ